MTAESEHIAAEAAYLQAQDAAREELASLRTALSAAEERAREAERRADFLAALAGKAIVWATLDPLDGEAPAEPADHALLASVWGLVQARAAAESSLSEERSPEGGES